MNDLGLSLTILPLIKLDLTINVNNMATINWLINHL